MSKIKTIILVAVVLVVGFFAYNYFFVSNNDTSPNLKDISKTASPTSTGSSTVAVGVNQNDQYVRQLIALKAIAFNFDLFSDDAYKILHAANTDIPPEDKGRHNPFAPIEFGDGQYTNTVATTTNAGFQIVATSSTPKIPVTNSRVKPR